MVIEYCARAHTASTAHALQLDFITTLIYVLVIPFLVRNSKVLPEAILLLYYIVYRDFITMLIIGVNFTITPNFSFSRASVREIQ